MLRMVDDFDFDKDYLKAAMKLIIFSESWKTFYFVAIFRNVIGSFANHMKTT